MKVSGWDGVGVGAKFLSRLGFCAGFSKPLLPVLMLQAEARVCIPNSKLVKNKTI